jgi:hypothetical protein
MFFNASPAGLTAASFRTRVVPNAVAPLIASITPGSVPTSLILNLNQVIPVNAWTCVEHRASERESCVGHLPADANQDRISSAEDVLDLEANLRNQFGPPAMVLYQCDLNRSGRCNPLDLLTATDLLNGSGFAAWLNVELESECPAIDSLIDRQPRGACCHLTLGGCQDNTFQQACASTTQAWVQDAACCDAPCAEPVGACCDRALGLCRNGVLESGCSRLSETWILGASCSQVSCAAELGACCNLDSGVCVDNLLRSQCTGASAVWSPGYTCNQVSCAPR